MISVLWQLSAEEEKGNEGGPWIAYQISARLLGASIGSFCAGMDPKA